MINLEITYKIKMPQVSQRFLNQAARAVSRQLKLKKELNVSLAFVSPLTIKKLNLAYRKRNALTDVLSFPELNEIIICYARAKSQAKKNQTTLNREIGWLFIHGLLHLLGFTHENKRKYLFMVRLQEKILKRFKD